LQSLDSEDPPSLANKARKSFDNNNNLHETSAATHPNSNNFTTHCVRARSFSTEKIIEQFMGLKTNSIRRTKYILIIKIITWMYGKL
jgi:hypothetical protein